MWFSYLIKYGKYIGMIAGIVSIFVGLLSFKSHYINVGYDKAVKEIQEKTNEKIQTATKNAIKDAEKKIKEALAKQRIIFDKELIRAKDERIVETEIREIISYVDKIKYKPGECNIFDVNFVELFNKPIDSANRATKN